MTTPPAIGLESSEETLKWLWENGFSAVVGDQPSFEAWPCQDPRFWLHEWCLAGWGLTLGELFDLEGLSRECEKRKRWSFFFSSMPLRVSSSHGGRTMGRKADIDRSLAGWPVRPTESLYFDSNNYMLNFQFYRQ